MAIIPRNQQSAMSGRAPSARPQKAGVSPQLAHGHAPTRMPKPPADPDGDMRGKHRRMGDIGDMGDREGMRGKHRRMGDMHGMKRPSMGTMMGAKAAMARAQSNPTQPKAAAMTAGPRTPQASPKRAMAGVPTATPKRAAMPAPTPATSLATAAAGMPARMMKSGGLVRKGNVSHGQYTKKC